MIQVHRVFRDHRGLLKVGQPLEDGLFRTFEKPGGIDGFLEPDRAWGTVSRKIDEGGDQAADFDERRTDGDRNLVANLLLEDDLFDMILGYRRLVWILAPDHPVKFLEVLDCLSRFLVYRISVCQVIRRPDPGHFLFDRPGLVFQFLEAARLDIVSILHLPDDRFLMVVGRVCQRQNPRYLFFRTLKQFQELDLLVIRVFGKQREHPQVKEQR
ncbi:MAG TPA: hypothetical protein PLU72_11445 [Candidatus Ozemobacteraceae bacterium]|nr:hypothetical protein [Candidatus Ozemobacteraceae bacterium]